MLRNSMSDNSAALARIDGYPLPRRCRRSATFLPALLVAGLVTGVSPGALAVPPPDPAPDHVWGGCVLNSNSGEIDTIAGLEADLKGGVDIDDAQVQVDFVLVYSLQNNNDGQALEGEAGFTGPILCTRSGESPTVTIDTTTEDTSIPPPEDQENDVTVDIEGIEEALFLQYHRSDATDATEREKRVCHTVAGHTDCFLIKPAPPLD